MALPTNSACIPCAPLFNSKKKPMPRSRYLDDEAGRSTPGGSESSASDQPTQSNEDFLDDASDVESDAKGDEEEVRGEEVEVFQRTGRRVTRSSTARVWNAVDSPPPCRHLAKRRRVAAATPSGSSSGSGAEEESDCFDGDASPPASPPPPATSRQRPRPLRRLEEDDDEGATNATEGTRRLVAQARTAEGLHRPQLAAAAE
eukprot:CAMPEP_0173427110 /NCGR_PEP_ID=MMETSP1357-20121228/6387_1 /TAXON_ID=77926 /ORGANISM="Hemiselmis rufescens, Strain PCC563" /LENGTH=201 /DNA_ID=CAMNT_0014390869 /DNA_START=415 /DNA_END=1017 /DNA_ORIENTATION=+